MKSCLISMIFLPTYIDVRTVLEEVFPACSIITLVPKTVRRVCKFCKQLAQESTKLIKIGLFLELDTLIPCPVHFGISKAWLPPYARLSSLYVVRRFTLLALGHELFNWIIVV